MELDFNENLDRHGMNINALENDFLPSQNSTHQKPISVISFDLDDTIWEAGPVLENAYKIQREWLVTTFPNISSLLPNMHSTLNYFEEAGLEAKRIFKFHDKSFINRRALEMIADQAGLPRELVVDPAFDAFLTARSNVSNYIYPGVLDTLWKLKERGFTLVSATNGNCDLDRVPELRDLFDHRVSAGSIGSPKPEPHQFLKVMELTGVTDPSEVLHVGDSVEHDVAGARSVGMYAIWVNRYRERNVNHNAHAVVDCVRNVESTISELLPQSINRE